VYRSFEEVNIMGTAPQRRVRVSLPREITPRAPDMILDSMDIMATGGIGIDEGNVIAKEGLLQQGVAILIEAIKDVISGDGGGKKVKVRIEIEVEVGG
jgi:hypothetical protein